MSRSASESEAAIGFSTSTSIPRSSSRQPMRACSRVGTATLTASTRPRKRIEIREAPPWQIPRPRAARARHRGRQYRPAPPLPAGDKRARGCVRNRPTPTTATRTTRSLIGPWLLGESPPAPGGASACASGANASNGDARFVSRFDQPRAIEKQACGRLRWPAR